MPAVKLIGLLNALVFIRHLTSTPPGVTWYCQAYEVTNMFCIWY